MVGNRLNFFQVKNCHLKIIRLSTTVALIHAKTQILRCHRNTQATRHKRRQLYEEEKSTWIF